MMFRIFENEREDYVNDDLDEINEDMGTDVRGRKMVQRMDHLILK